MKKNLTRCKFLWAASLAFLLAGCGVPKAMVFDVDVLQPTKYVLDVEDRSTAFVATYSDDKSDSAAVAAVALGAARQIEENNALEEGTIGAFTIPASEYKGAEDKEYLEQLMLATGNGCLAIINNLTFKEGSLKRGLYEYYGSNIIAIVPVIANLDIYDALTDTMLFQTHVIDSIKFLIPEDYVLTEESLNNFMSENRAQIFNAFGAKIADKVSQKWNQEEWMLIDYPDNTSWHKAYTDAMEFKWEEAVKVWMPSTEDSDSKRASYAAFNIAVACQMMGETDLALNWIKYSRQRYDFAEASQLQRYLENKKSLSR